MKSRKRTIILIIGLVFIGLTFFGIIIKKNMNNEKLIDIRAGNNIVDLIISNRFKDLDNKTIENIKRYSEEVVINSNINEEIINTNFILGYLKLKDNVYNLNIKHDFSEVEDRVTISVGISTAYIVSNKDYDDYIKKADKALYEAKKEGRNTFLHLS